MLLRWWKEKNSQQLAGLDIKSDAVNILKINIASKPYQVEVYASAPLAKDAVQKNEIKDLALNFLASEQFEKIFSGNLFLLCNEIVKFS